MTLERVINERVRQLDQLVQVSSVQFMSCKQTLTVTQDFYDHHHRCLAGGITLSVCMCVVFFSNVNSDIRA